MEIWTSSIYVHKSYFCCLPQDLKLFKETSFTIQTNYVLTARCKNIKLLSRCMRSCDVMELNTQSEASDKVNGV